MALPHGALGCLQFVIVVFPDHTHEFGVICVIIYLDSGVHRYVLTTTNLGKILVSKIH